MAQRVAVIGAGVGGLAAAALLAARGCAVTVFERAERCGGKMREVMVDGRPIDSGPTVFTMRWVFEALFAEAGGDFSRALALTPAGVLARHAWDRGAALDLHAEIEASAEAIAAFAGPAEGRAFREFIAEAGAIHATLRQPFLEAERPSPISLARRVGLDRLDALMALRPFETLAAALARRFADPRLRQLFGRYATYCGSSPYAAPATLMLVAHVEQEGVWLVEGGMARLADALRALAEAAGAAVRCKSEVATLRIANGRCVGLRLASGEEIAADAVVVNADPAALASGVFGHEAQAAVAPWPRRARSLSAVTWSLVAETAGFDLARHTVMFSPDYEAEFADLSAKRRTPRDPTVYVCAQDRDDRGGARAGPERLFVLVNAPADGDLGPMNPAELEACQESAFSRLEAAGLNIAGRGAGAVRTTPTDFHRLFPGTGGALYGRASHGWAASFQRPAARTRVAGLYLAGGATHPGPGVPMAALSGRTAARAALSDLASTRTFRPAATPGGTSTPRARMDATG